MEARARFYLGQSHYFSGSYREALIEFISVQSLYPVEANEWIQEILSRLVN
jgi:TolA-binding protein